MKYYDFEGMFRMTFWWNNILFLISGFKIQTGRSICHQHIQRYAILCTPQQADRLAHLIKLACRTNIDIMYKMLHYNKYTWQTGDTRLQILTQYTLCNVTDISRIHILWNTLSV